ncbi:hypothetical protein EH220_04980 [bacterium]|nr:MAG: hypothetical protein EH220_04980 [bacterium]
MSRIDYPDSCFTQTLKALDLHRGLSLSPSVHGGTKGSNFFYSNTNTGILCLISCSSTDPLNSSVSQLCREDPITIMQGLNSCAASTNSRPTFPFRLILLTFNPCARKYFSAKSSSCRMFASTSSSSI